MHVANTRIFKKKWYFKEKKGGTEKEERKFLFCFVFFCLSPCGDVQSFNHLHLQLKKKKKNTQLNFKPGSLSKFCFCFCFFVFCLFLFFVFVFVLFCFSFFLFSFFVLSCFLKYCRPINGGVNFNFLETYRVL